MTPQHILEQKLRIVPITFADAAEFCQGKHRTHKRRPAGHKFSIAAAMGDRIVGVAIVGRPKARHLDDGLSLEVNRVATDGTRNACSALYGACRRAAWALGYLRLITYTIPSEGGASLRGAGYRLIGERGGGSWGRPSRPRIDDHPLEEKWLWEARP